MKTPVIHHCHHYTYPNAVGQPAQLRPRPQVETCGRYENPAKAGWHGAAITPGQCARACHTMAGGTRDVGARAGRRTKMSQPDQVAPPPTVRLGLRRELSRTLTSKPHAPTRWPDMTGPGPDARR